MRETRLEESVFYQGSKCPTNVIHSDFQRVQKVTLLLYFSLCITPPHTPLTFLCFLLPSILPFLFSSILPSFLPIEMVSSKAIITGKNIRPFIIVILLKYSNLNIFHIFFFSRGQQRAFTWFQE